jgi:glutaminase
MAFNELIQIDQERGAVRNPFVNAGALVVTDILCSSFAQPELALLQSLRRWSGSQRVDIDHAVMLSERETCHRNAAIGHLLKSYGRIQNSVETVLDTYCRQCAVTMDCRQLARSGLMLAGEAMSSSELSTAQRHSVIAVMMTCGTYNASGDFAARVGLPLKSGVGGGILAVIPGIGALCAWSPGLDPSGNSVAAGKALELFARHTGVSVLAQRGALLPERP